MEWSRAARAAACCCLLAPLVAQARVPTAPGPGRIEGVVLDALGRPLAGADVWLAGSSAPHVQTDANGAFAFGQVPRGRAAVHAHRRGLHTGGTAAEVTDTSPCVFARVVLLPAADVVVSVVDERDAPVAGAEVVPSRTAIPEPWPDAADQRFVTGADGRVVVADQALGHTAFLAWAPGFVLAVDEGYVGDAAEVRIRLARGDGLALRLVMSNQPADRLRKARWQLHAVRAGRACLLPPSLVAGTFDDRGRAAVNGLSWDLASVQVVVTTADAAVHPKSVDIVPARSASPRPLEFSAVAADADVRGIVFDPAGRPLPGLRLACRTPGALAELEVEARSGGDGAFCFPAVTPPGGSFCLASLDPRFALNQSKGNLRETARQRRLFTGTAAAHTLFEVQCVAAMEIRGRIVDARRQGVAGMGVRLVTRDTGQAGPLDIAATTSDRDGMSCSRARTASTSARSGSKQRAATAADAASPSGWRSARRFRCPRSCSPRQRSSKASSPTPTVPRCPARRCCSPPTTEPRPARSPTATAATGSRPAVAATVCVAGADRIRPTRSRR